MAQGFLQVPQQDFDAPYMSVAKFTTLQALLAISTRANRGIHQVDIRGAYLQGDLEEPDGIVEPDHRLSTNNSLWRQSVMENNQLKFLLMIWSPIRPCRYQTYF